MNLHKSAVFFIVILALCTPCFAAPPVVLFPPGPLMLAAAGLTDTNDVEVLVWKTPEEAMTKLVTGDATAAVLPVTLGAALSTRVEMTLLGVFREDLFSLILREEPGRGVTKLTGKEIIVAQGRGTVLDLLLRALLNKEGVDPDRSLALVYAPAPEALALYKRGKGNGVALPEPFATIAAEEGGVVVDLEEKWGQKTGSFKDIPAAGLFALTSRTRERPEEALLVRSRVEESALLYERNPSDSFSTVRERFGLSDHFRKALPRIRISFDRSKEALPDVEAFLRELYDTLPAGTEPPSFSFAEGPGTP